MSPWLGRLRKVPLPQAFDQVNILFIGDIFASVGRAIVADHLKDIIGANSIDLCIANAENSAGGFGITPNVAEELFAMGIDVLTGGNHSFDKREISDYIGTHPRLLRPANYPPGTAGHGVYSSETRTGIPYSVLNLQGRTYMPATDCPFRKADELLAALPAATLVRFVS
jgi:calcineurin-like phosphoesterase